MSIKISFVIAIVLMLNQDRITPRVFELTKWRIISLPLTKDELHAASYSSLQWDVEIVDGKVLAETSNEKNIREDNFTFPSGYHGLPPNYVKKVRDGWLAAFNQGEFGASFRWISEDGRTSYEISKDQVHGLAYTEIGILGIEGLAHLTIRKGRILKVSQSSNGQWLSEEFLNLGDAPYAMTDDHHGNLFIVTS